MDFYAVRKRDSKTLEEVISFHGEVRMSELSNLNLGPLERGVLKDMQAPSDYLLALGMVFRLHEERAKSEQLQEKTET